MTNELSYDKLKKPCTLSMFDFETTEDIEASDEIIGQPKAAEALKFGLNIKTKGYNIYVCGMSGTGKTTFARRYAEDTAKNMPIPDDICYVYNFENPKIPRLLKFKTGGGKAFKDEMEELIDVLSIEIPKAFNTNDYTDEKDKIVRTYQDMRDEVIKNMTDEAKEHGFGAKITNTGMYFLPIIDGETISEEDFENLSEEQKDEIAERSELIHDKASVVMRRIREIEHNTKKEIEDVDYTIGLLTVGRFINSLQDKYADNAKVSEYLSDVKEDILVNIEDFIVDEQDEDEAMPFSLPWMGKRTTEENFEKYNVNLIVDNSKNNGAPVIIDYNPTYTNLIGEVEYDNEYGNFTTDYMKIKPGLLHKANGGFLILQTSDLLSNAFAWESLRRSLKTNKIIIEPLKEYQLGGIAVTTIKPEPLDIDLKVILIGSSYYYEALASYDDEFLKQFKICAMFDYEMDYTPENIKNVAQFIKGYIDKENMLSFDSSAICELIEYSSRLSEKQHKLTTRFSALSEILTEASTWATLENAEIISKQHIRKAIDKKISFVNLYEKKLDEMIDSNELMIDTDGAEIGQINGLVVLDMGSYTFGRPARITATTYMGKAGIINIEKEVDLSGSIHDKGVQVLSGYLGQNYAQEFPLSLSCRICFEQSYSGVDGDSASSAELYAVLSSLASLPIRQDIAVTGSINQKGIIQPIGGVIYKIEGFFEICKKRGLTGKQGVIIPFQNVGDLMLKDEVVEAVKNGLFHIYAIKTIDEGLELLTGVKAGKRSVRGKYPQDSVHGKVMKKLKQYHKISYEEE